MVFDDGQGDLINSKMFELRIRGHDGRARVEKSRKVQGTKAKIVIVSFAGNIPDDELNLGSVPEERGLCVALSRARQSLVLVGNFGAWMRKRLEGNPMLMDESNIGHFGALLQDIVDQQDLISAREFRLFLDS